VRSHVPLLLVLGGVLACPLGPSDPPEDGDASANDGRERETFEGGDPRLDPQRCTGDALDIEELIKAGTCTIPLDRARPLPSEDRLVIEVPQRLKVAAGQPLEFDLVLRNVGREPLDLDLEFRRLLPLAPESTTWIGKGPAPDAGPDPSCTLRPISTEPPPERITLPANAELPVPCEWHANTRLVDPTSYVGSECPDFPQLAAGDWRSVFRIGGRTIEVDIKVK
jgi:hypothetical protein